MYPWVQKGAAITDAGRKKFSQLKLHEIKKILVIRHAALGDMVMTRPFLYELKKLFPQAEIILSLNSKYQYGAPKDLADSVHVLYGSEVKNKSLLDKYRNLKEVGEVDLLIDIACTARSHVLSFLTKSKLKMAFPYRRMNWLYDICVFRSDLNHEACILQEFLYLFGHKPEFPLNYKLPIQDLNKAAKRIAYFMGSSTFERNYPLDRFAQVIDKLASLYPDYDHIILQGVKDDEKFIDTFEKLSHHKNVKLQSSMSLESLTLFLSQVRMLVSNDTGVRHVALGTHTPTVCFFSTSVPFRNWPRYENIHDCVLSSYGEPAPVEAAVTITKNLLEKIYS